MDTNMNIPRPEHPNPQWERSNWRNLNGEWEFEFDFSKSARERNLFKGGPLSDKITVPFCPESKLSGIGYTDFIPSVCYRKIINITEPELSGRVFLHFGAVDYHAFLYVNGKPVGDHRGGYASFKFDITKYLHVGENTLFVIAEDDTKSRTQPTGKQSQKQDSYDYFYTRTTGIWQTVWLEFAPKEYVKSCKFYPNIDTSSLTVIGEAVGNGEICFVASYEGKEVGCVKTKVKCGRFDAVIQLSELHLWEIGHGRLYDLDIRFGDDEVKSYFGMREVCLDGIKFKLNGKPCFMRMVLDQGFYPDGIYTARDESCFLNDIAISKAVGFDGARLHQKVFEKRFIYHCDKEGYIVWGEHANWGMNYTNGIAQENFICEWLEILERDFNNPSIIGWCPFNETWGYIEKDTSHRFMELTYKMTKLYDSTRPCIDTSGNYHLAQKEIHDVHDYEQNVELFRGYYAHIDEGIVNCQVRRRHEEDVQPYCGEPIFVSEYGGIKWAPDSEKGWGYGNAPKTIEEFADRYCGLTSALIENPYITGACYTQLYDVEQEQNGIYNYDRTPKFSPEIQERFRLAMQAKAAIEN